MPKSKELAPDYIPALHHPWGEKDVGAFRQVQRAIACHVRRVGIDIEEIPFVEYSHLITEWLKLNALPITPVSP